MINFINDCRDETNVFIWSIIIFMKTCNNENEYALLTHFVSFHSSFYVMLMFSGLNFNVNIYLKVM